MTGTATPVSRRTLMAYGLGKIIPGLLLFLAVPLWTRTFGSEQYGIYSIAWSVALFSSSLSTGWIRQALLRHTGNDAATLRSLPRWPVPVASLLSCLPVAFLVAFQLHHVGDALSFAVAALVFTVVNAAYTVFQASAQREGRSTTFTLAEVLRVGGAIIVSLPLNTVAGVEGATAIIAAFCLSTGIAVVVLQWPALVGQNHQRSRLPPTSGISTLTLFWNYGWPMAIWLAASSLLLYQDRVIIGAILGPRDAGEYAAVADVIVRGFAMVSFPLTMMSHPLIMAAWNRGEPTTAISINRTFQRYLSVISIVIVVGGCFLGRTVLQAVLGIDIEEPVLVPLLLVGAALWQLGLMTHKELEMENKTRVMALLIVSVALLSAIINVLIVRWTGVLGPAAVFAAGAGAYALTTYTLGARLRSRSTHA